ncbi:class II fructose-bisphosphate aldolase [Hamadaea tsunoensis]|uniref:class II fructose-bisphosphate aldolase n=1 Tax=Hamadaea tsunoensis TaxID=53368 RepID=UPI00041F1B0D|nr:class II fructose-bisphosphate aldolase [Hamadaea tsunoensis]
MITPTADLVRSAATAGVGLAAFNVVTLEHAEAIVRGAEQAERPVILQISENTVLFHQGQLAPVAAASLALARAASVPVALHLDHVTDVDLLRQAPECGFSSVMFDASTLEYAENVAATAAAADFCHAHGLWLEGELGAVGGKGGAHAPGVRTRPDEAVAFARDTRVDLLAVAVGSSHAMTDRSARLDHELIGELRSAVPVPLVLHGSSGVPDLELAAGITAGLVKINIGTALNIAYTAGVRSVLDSDPKAVDPRKALKAARSAMADAVTAALLVLAPEGSHV